MPLSGDSRAELHTRPAGRGLLQPAFSTAGSENYPQAETQQWWTEKGTFLMVQGCSVLGTLFFPSAMEPVPHLFIYTPRLRFL